MRNDSAEILFQLFFSKRGPCQQFWRGQGRPLFDVVQPAFSLPTMASPTLQGFLKDGVGEVAWRATQSCIVKKKNSLAPIITVPEVHNNNNIQVCRFASFLLPLKKIYTAKISVSFASVSYTHLTLPTTAEV